MYLETREEKTEKGPACEYKKVIPMGVILKDPALVTYASTLDERDG